MKKVKLNKEKKKDFTIAIILAIAFSLFVWLYLKNYKKFFIWLGVIVITSIIEIYIFPAFGFVSTILRIIMWVSAISDAWKLKKKK